MSDLYFFNRAVDRQEIASRFKDSYRRDPTAIGHDWINPVKDDRPILVFPRLGRWDACCLESFGFSTPRASLEAILRAFDEDDNLMIAHESFSLVLDKNGEVEEERWRNEEWVSF